MKTGMSNFHFRMMSLFFKLRDFFIPRENILKETDIKKGFCVLDYGCGPGSYITVAAKLVGKSGKVYALDIHPLAIQKIQNIVLEEQLTNVETIHSDCKTDLQDNSVDVVLLYDIFHDLSAPGEVLKELHRILKLDGSLSFSDHHMKENEIISKVTEKGLFKLSKRGKKTYSFLKEKL